MDFADTEQLARWIVGSGPDVVVVDPPELRAAVVGRLRAAITGTAATLAGTAARGVAFPPAGVRRDERPVSAR